MKSARYTAEVRTQYGSFKAVFEPEHDMGGYVATAPKVQGAVSWGRTLAQAKKMIAECIEGAIETRVIADAIEEGNVRLSSHKNAFALA